MMHLFSAVVIDIYGVTWAAAAGVFLSVLSLIVSVTSLWRQAKAEKRRREAVIFASSNEVQWDLEEHEVEPLALNITNFGEQACYDVHIEFDYSPLLHAYRECFPDDVVSQAVNEEGRPFFELRCHYDGPRRTDKHRMYIEEAQSNKSFDGVGPSVTKTCEIKYQVQEAITHFVVGFGEMFGRKPLQSVLEELTPFLFFSITYTDANKEKWKENYAAGVSLFNLGMRQESMVVTRFRMKMNIESVGKEHIG